MPNEVYLKVVNGQKITVEEDEAGVVVRFNDQDVFLLIVYPETAKGHALGLINSNHSDEQMAEVHYNRDDGLSIRCNSVNMRHGLERGFPNTHVLKETW